MNVLMKIVERVAVDGGIDRAEAISLISGYLCKHHNYSGGEDIYDISDDFKKYPFLSEKYLIGEQISHLKNLGFINSK